MQAERRREPAGNAASAALKPPSIQQSKNLNTSQSRRGKVAMGNAKRRGVTFSSSGLLHSGNNTDHNGDVGNSVITCCEWDKKSFASVEDQKWRTSVQVDLTLDNLWKM